MNLLKLTGQVCRTFYECNAHEMRSVQKVKEHQRRDVVTELDLKLHFLTKKFLEDQDRNYNFLSEEDVKLGFDSVELLRGEWLVVDPLDGSSNYAMGLPNYGYMATRIRCGYVEGCAVVLPEHNQYILFDEGRSIYSQPLPAAVEAESGTVYYAYPPSQASVARKARTALQQLIDEKSAGMYRYGSSCVGLYQLLCGKHLAFIGHDVRLWDVLAFMPIMASQNIKLKYRINGLSISIVASKNEDFIDAACATFENQEGVHLHNFFLNDLLKVDVL